MVGWHHQLNALEFEQAPGVSDGQGSMVCCSQWGHKESGTTEQLNLTESFIYNISGLLSKFKKSNEQNVFINKSEDRC